MKQIFVFFFLVTTSFELFGQIISPEQNKYNLANSFYQNKEYEKAAPLFLELYEDLKLNTYLDLYINSLVNSENYEEAEKAIKKEMKRDKSPNLQITLGSVYKQAGKIDEANKTFKDVIDDLKPSPGLIISVANSFFNRGEYAYAEQTYIKGRELIPGELFRNNLATVYAYERNYESMTDEYLALLREDEKNMSLVQARLSSLLRYDFDNTLRILVKKELIKSIQEAPNVLSFNQLLIWLFVQENNYKEALSQSIALDKRTKSEEASILTFAQSASSEGQYSIALTGLEYLLKRIPAPTNLSLVKQEEARLEYQQFITTPKEQRQDMNTLASKLESLLSEFGYTTQTADIARDYSFLLAHYLKNTDKAFQVINDALASKNIDNTQYTLLRIELADLTVYAGDLWEALFLYGQIIDTNKNNPMGDDVKLKKAKVSFFLGNIEYAKAQLDVIKASTSKLTANDAMELSLLIASCYEMDTIMEPIQMFASADLLILQDKDSLALSTFDSIEAKYSGHALTDRILMRKAYICERNFDFEKAVSIYAQIVSDYGFSSSADDALYHLAILTDKKLNNPEKAMEYYKQILVSYPSSIYVSDARDRFREKRGDVPPADPFDLFNTQTEDNFFGN